ncbi:hypothetical protein DEDE109153_09285 [Deinococcus deserti]
MPDPSSLRVLKLRDVRLDNLAVRPMHAGVTAAPTVSASAPITLNGKYTSAFNNCKAVVSGIVTCAVTLTPVR